MRPHIRYTRSSKVRMSTARLVTLDLYLPSLNGFATPVYPVFRYGPQASELTIYLVRRMRSSNLRPGHPQQSHGDPARNNVVPSEGMNSTSSTPLPSDAIYKPSPPYDPHSIDRPRPVNPLRHQPPQPETRSLWQLIRTPAVTAVVLLQVFLLLKCDDPLEAIIDLEPATRRASNENATLVLEKERAQREREVTAREKASWENAKEARIPHGAFWDVVSPIPYCEAYGKREYRGVLRNIPEGWDVIEACMSMPVVIKGVQLRRPDWCTRFMEFPRIRVAGYWMVDWDQPDCKPWFRDFKDRVGVNLSSVYVQPWRDFHTYIQTGMHRQQLRETSTRSSVRRLPCHRCS